MRLIRRDVNDFREDVERIAEACRRNGYEVSLTDADWAWREYSESEMCAGFMSPSMYSDDSLTEIMRRYLVEDVIGHG